MNLARYIFLLLLSLVFLPDLKAQEKKLFREERPFAFKLGFEGFGADVTFFNYVGVDLTTFLLSTSAKARFLILQRNATPFVGIGVRRIGPGFGGGTENELVSIHAGWEHSYEHVLIQIFIQTAIKQSDPYGDGLFLINVNAGYRF